MRINELRGRIDKISALLEIYSEEAKKTAGKGEEEAIRTGLQATKEQLLDELLEARRLLRGMEQETENV